MAKQLLIYSTVIPVTRQEHGDLCFKSEGRFDFARTVNAAPLVLGEFQASAGEYAIVFAETEGTPVPVALFGIAPETNAFVDAEGNWSGTYVPAFLRRWPFVFSTDEKGETLTLCIDETAPGFNREGRGERLFDAEGSATVFTHRMLQFLQEYQAQHQRTLAFCKRLQEFDLLQPVEARVELGASGPRTLTGMRIVNREKLRALTAEQLAEFMQNDWLELIYSHLFSLRELERLREKAMTALAAAA
jgi:hypothetical protein